MTDARGWRRHFIVLVVLTATSPLCAQVEVNNPATASESTTASLPSIADVMAQRQALSQDTALDDAIRSELDQSFAKALEHLQEAEKADRRIAELAEELETALPKVAELEELLTTAPTSVGTPTTTDGGEGLEALDARLKEAESVAASAHAELDRISTEIEWRANRRPVLADRPAQVEQELQVVSQSLSSPAPDGEAAPVTAARILRLQCRQHRLRREAALLDQESRTYERTARYWTLQMDLADRTAREADRTVQALREQTALARWRAVKQDAEEAERIVVELSDTPLRNDAEYNLQLANENIELVEALRETQVELSDAVDDLEESEAAFSSLKERAEAAEFSPDIGVLLRNRQSALPDRDDIYYRIRSRQSEISALNLRLKEWESDRKPLVDLATATSEIIEEIESESGSLLEIEEQVQSVLAARSSLLRDLVENGNSQLDHLVRLNSREQQLLDTLDSEATWLAEHVLWVRSTVLFGTQPKTFVNSAATLLDGQSWRSAAGVILLDLSGNPWLWGTATIVFIGLLLVHRRAKRNVYVLGDQAARSNCTEFLPTVRALGLTLLVAAPFPSLTWSMGLRLRTISHGENTLQSLGVALQVTAGAWAIIEFIRHIAHRRGIGDSHFNWPEKSMLILRRTMRLLMLTLLPTLMIVTYTEQFGDDELSSTIGRLAFLASIGCSSWGIYQLIRPSSPILQALRNKHSESLLWRTRWIWTGLSLGGPALLIVLSVTGFHYTAVQLSGRVAAMIGSGLVALLITALLSRWLLVSYRKLAIRRSREQRETLQAAQVESDQPIAQDALPEIPLSDINVQARRLLYLVAGAGTLVAVYLIWVDVLPAFGVLKRFELWPNNLISVPDDEPAVWVTAQEFLIALAIGMLTVVSSRNVPGLMEIVILRRLPLDAGARYAASSVSRYLIVLTGLLFGFREIGIGWTSVQWLVAAMTVGLGFGLQEIFANFVSGIILLFERPIRVGDTVTIGDITGTVTRIQIRATTITDWDNKELIVPNREFVTGNLINWTLANHMLRLTVTVGIAYGSDTRLATQLLYRIANEDPNVLDDPEPVVVFTEFGESSLNFELRLFVSSLLLYRRHSHVLNLAIDDLFRQHKIEIAFPQRDLHVRSLPQEFPGHQRPARPSAVVREEVPVDQT